MKRTTRKTLFMEVRKNNIIMFNDFKEISYLPMSDTFYVKVERDGKLKQYIFPRSEVVWYEEKISNFVEINQEGGDA